MAGGPTKNNPPNSHPSNPIHKTATKTDAKPSAAPATQTSKESAPTEQTEEPTPPAGSGSEYHDANKIAAAFGAVAVAGLLFLSFR